MLCRGGSASRPYHTVSTNHASVVTVSNIPASELAEHVTRVIEASDVNSTPSVVETVDGAIVNKTSRPSTESLLCAGAQGRLDLQGDQTYSRRTIAKTLGRGYA